MTDFRTRFNYFIFSLIIIGFLIFLSLAFIIIIYGSTLYHLISAHEKNKTAMNIGLSMVPIGILWMLFFWGRILKNYRTILTFRQNSIAQTDAIFLTTKEFPISDIDGYIDTSYLGDVLMKCIVIYLKDGSSIRVLNYLTLNFDNLKSTLKSHSIKRIKS